jgi:hypothetical protein
VDGQTHGRRTGIRPQQVNVSDLLLLQNFVKQYSDRRRRPESNDRGSFEILRSQNFSIRQFMVFRHKANNSRQKECLDGDAMLQRGSITEPYVHDLLLY